MSKHVTLPLLGYFTSSKCPELKPTQPTWQVPASMCPDFATGGNEARPMKANSQTARVIAALAGGWKGHIGELSNTIHTLNPKARLSEARTWLASNGITLKDEYRQLGEARVKYYWLEPLDQVVAWERLKKATERKKQCLYRIRGFTASV